MTNSSDVVVIATLIPLADKREALEEALRVAVRGAHREQGCRLYALHRTVRGEEALVVVERWESAAELAAHGRGDAFSALSAQLDHLLAEPMEALVLEPIPEGDPTLGRL